MAKFRLEPVLKLRKHREEARKRELAAAVAAENQRKEAALHLAELRTDQSREFRDRQQAGRLDVRMLVEQRAYIGLLDREIGHRLRDVARAEHATAGCRTKLVQAVTDRRALEVLHDRLEDRERGEAQRRETAELDETAVRMHRDGRLVTS